MGEVFDCSGAGEKSRTPDLRITNALLYQLSYTGVQGAKYSGPLADGRAAQVYVTHCAHCAPSRCGRWLKLCSMWRLGV